MKISEVSDHLLAQHERRFEKQQKLVQRTGEKLELEIGNTVILGGAGLTLHGLDTRIGGIFAPTFDVDALISEEKLISLKRKHRVITFMVDSAWSNNIEIVRPVAPVPFHGFTEPHWSFVDFPYENYSDAAEDQVEIDGLPTLPLSTLARMKVSAERQKDIFGLIKAHVIGHETGHPATTDPEWTAEIGNSLNKIRDHNISKRNTPQWLSTLAAQDFQHPAFEDLS